MAFCGSALWCGNRKPLTRHHLRSITASVLTLCAGRQLSDRQAAIFIALHEFRFFHSPPLCDKAKSEWRALRGSKRVDDFIIYIFFFTPSPFGYFTTCVRDALSLIAGMRFSGAFFPLGGLPARHSRFYGDCASQKYRNSVCALPLGE